MLNAEEKVHALNSDVAQWNKAKAGFFMLAEGEGVYPSFHLGGGRTRKEAA